jgi:hypothetical protein
MSDDTRLNPGTGGDLIATDELATLNGGAAPSGLKVQRVKLGFGVDGALQDVSATDPLPVTGNFWQATQPVSFTWAGLTDAQLRANAVPVSGPLTDAQLRAAALPVSGTFWQATQPVSLASQPLPTGASTEATLSSIDSKTPDLLSTVPFNNASAPPTRLVGQDIWNCSFASVGASLLSDDFITPIVGTGVTYSQAAGSLNIVTGTSTNAEFLTRSVQSWRGSLRMRFSLVASQRIANQNLQVTLADLIGAGLAFTIVSATVVNVTLTGHGYTNQNVGQFMNLGGITGAAGVPGRYAIAAIVDVNTIQFTVAGWPASGSGTLTLFGRNYVRNLVNGTTATNLAWDAQRRGWATGDTTATINTTAAPGTIIQNDLNGRDAFLMDQVRATSTTPNFSTRASRYENLPDEDVVLYVFIWSYNGTVAPASTTTWTLGMISVEKFANIPVYLQGMRANGAANALPVAFPAAQSVTLTANTPTLAAGTNRAGFVAGAGIWYDDSSTNLAANATFTGTSRDATVTATATAFANAATYAKEVRLSAESDVTGTLWLEVSRDNTNWRRVKSVATAAVSGGGFYAEIVQRPSWRYWRAGYTNGAGAQARFALGSVAMAV